MRFSLTEDEQMIVDGVADLCTKSVASQAAQWEQDGDLSDAALAEVGALGLFGLSAPEADGGIELSCVARTAVVETLGAGDASLATVIAAHDGLASAHVLRAGTQAQRGAWLPSWTTGEALATWCAPSEGITMTASADGVVLRGQTEVLIGATKAQWLVINVADDDGGVHTWVVPADASGVDVIAADRLGLRASAAGHVVLDGVCVGADRQLGTVDDGVAAALVAERRITLAAIACGVARSAIAVAATYAVEREQFGKPIAQFQAIQWKLADAATNLDAASLTTRRAAWCIDAGRPDAAAAARGHVAAMQAAQTVCSDALQIHGGYGYTQEYPVERALRAVKTLSVMAGTTRASRAVIGAAIAARHG